jgi:putative transposase
MPRRARLAIAGIPWHIMHRGNNRSPCFFRPDDYRYYLRVLSEQAVQHGCAIHAYVLMTNHVHLLITPAEQASAANMMKLVAQHHTQYINRTYERSGTLWEGRFKSCLSREESYVLTCYRYIELNPVRAGMVPHPGRYAWSSYASNGGEQTDPMLTPHPHYLGLGATTDERARVYRRFLAAWVDPNESAGIRQATIGNTVLGSPHFQEELAKTLGRRASRGRRGRPFKTAD